MAGLFSRAAALLLVAVAVVQGPCAAEGAAHQWRRVADMLWADFGSPRLLTDAQTAFIATNYAIVSVEKCFGRQDGLVTEDAFVAQAARFKAANAQVRLLFYWHSTVDISGPGFKPCYRSGSTFLANPSWWLRNDTGGPVLNGPFLYHDLLSPAVRDYMVGVPLAILRAHPDLFDGIFADGNLPGPYAGIASPTRVDAENNAINLTTQAMATAFRAAPRGPYRTTAPEVIGNGIAFYHQANPVFPADGGLGMLPYLDGVCVEHFASFEMLDPQNCSTKPALMERMLRTIQTIARQNKTVLIKSWPGPASTPINSLGPTYPAACKATAGASREERAAQMAEWFEPELALFLLHAGDTVFWSYSWWYDVHDGYYPSWTANETSAPAEWFPQYQSDLGPPLGEARKLGGASGYLYARNFTGAYVTADLADLASGRVHWLSQ